MKLLTTFASNVAGTEETNPWYRRSAMKLWAFTLVLLIVTAWSSDASILATLKERSVELLVELGAALGISGVTRSGKV